jgi:WD40 repeat protein
LLAAGNFWQLRFSRDERLLGAVTGPIRTWLTVLVWDLASGKELARFEPAHRDSIRDLDFSPDRTVVATASADNTSKLLDLRTHKDITLPGQLMSVCSVCFSPDGRRLATGTGDGEILIWDLGTRREVLVLKAAGSGVVGGARFHPSGDSLLSINYPGSLHLWRAPSWAEIEAAEKGTEGKTQ